MVDLLRKSTKSEGRASRKPQIASPSLGRFLVGLGAREYRNALKSASDRAEPSPSPVLNLGGNVARRQVKYAPDVAQGPVPVLGTFPGKSERVGQFSQLR
jgi:hypothetical protein